MTFDIRFDDRTGTITIVQQGNEYDFRPRLGDWRFDDFILNWGFAAYDLIDDYGEQFLPLEPLSVQGDHPLEVLRCVRGDDDLVVIEERLVHQAVLTPGADQPYGAIDSYAGLEDAPQKLPGGTLTVSLRDLEKWHFGEFQDLLKKILDNRSR